MKDTKDNTLDLAAMPGVSNPLIEVLLKNKETGEIIGKTLIKKALLAKYFRPLTEHQVSAQNGMFVVEV